MILCHACCAPCLVMPLRELRQGYDGVTVYWNNPNIHPFTEYRARLGALRSFAAIEGLELIEEGPYDVVAWLHAVPHGADRCLKCLRGRLHAAFACAVRRGFSAVTTTMLYSPYLQHATIKACGIALAAETGIEFLYRDWRPRYRAGQAAARELDLYRQKYCGCIYSEAERYVKQIRNIVE